MLLNYLTPRRCALLVVDIQERLMPVINERERVVKNSVLLIKSVQTLNIPIIATTQYSARIGPLLPEIGNELTGVELIDKMEFSCFANNNFIAELKKLPKEVDTLIVCGVETHICIYQTVLGGLMNGYKMWIPADAVSSRAEFNYRSGLDRIKQIGGAVVNTELVIYELLGRAGTAEFKQLLPLLK